MDFMSMMLCLATLISYPFNGQWCRGDPLLIQINNNNNNNNRKLWCLLQIVTVCLLCLLQFIRIITHNWWWSIKVISDYVTLLNLVDI